MDPISINKPPFYLLRPRSKNHINRFPKLVNALLFSWNPFAKFLPRWVWSYIKSQRYKPEEGAGTQEARHNKSVCELGIHPNTQPGGFPAGFQPQRFRAIPLVSLWLHPAICRCTKGRLLLKLALDSCTQWLISINVGRKGLLKHNIKLRVKLKTLQTSG